MNNKNHSKRDNHLNFEFMKKKVFFSCALAALMLGSCSSSDDVNGGGTGLGDNKTSYISVNINSVGNAPTSRAEYDQGGGTYEDGEGTESTIKKVRFYFFNADGTPYILNNAGTTGTANYVDVDMTKDGDKHDQTVETVTNAVLVLNGESNLAPASMLTVVNPASAGDLLGSGAMRYSILRNSTTGSTWKNAEGFVMSNSVYMQAGADVCATQLAGKLHASQDDAMGDPVEVYVERVLAKVTAAIKTDFKRDNETENAWSKENDGTWKIKVGTLKLAGEEGGSSEVHDIYALIQGWGVADTNGKAELTKQVKPTWTNAILGITPWNSVDYHRCFWSSSCAVTGDNPLVNQSFNDYTKQKFDGTSVYPMPNTPDENPVTNPTTSKNNLTKVLVAAKLAYKDGDAWKDAEICEYKGQEFLGQEKVKTVILNENKHYFVQKTSADGKVEYKNMDADNIEFVTTTSDNDKLQDYQVVAHLKGVTKLYRYSDDGSKVAGSADNYTEVSLAEVNKALAQNPVEIRTDGYTYYYTPIKHLGTEGSLGEYGVVRNHSYKINIKDIQGWGTPVYDPEKVIIPSLPSNEKTYLAAQVKVLSWRVVSSDVDLNQTKKQ